MAAKTALTTAIAIVFLLFGPVVTTSGSAISAQPCIAPCAAPQFHTEVHSSTHGLYQGDASTLQFLGIVSLLPAAVLVGSLGYGLAGWQRLRWLLRASATLQSGLTVIGIASVGFVLLPSTALAAVAAICAVRD